MFAFLFDRRSGLKTGLLVTALALLLFAGGILVGLNLRWSREDVTAAVLKPPPLKALLADEEDGAGAAGEGAATQPRGPADQGSDAAPAAPDGSGEAPATDAPPADWVPMTEGAPPPAGSREP